MGRFFEGFVDTQLIPNISVWLERNQGETDYHITQFLTGQGGCYRQYLSRCPVSSNTLEDADHLIFHWSGFAIERRNLNQAVERSGNLESMVEDMLRSKESWLLGNCNNTKQVCKGGEEEENSKTRNMSTTKGKATPGKNTKMVIPQCCG